MKANCTPFIRSVMKLIPRRTANGQTFPRNPRFLVNRNLNNVAVNMAHPPNHPFEAVAIATNLLTPTATIPTENKAKNMEMRREIIFAVFMLTESMEN
jgi:hypothetical protein